MRLALSECFLLYFLRRALTDCLVTVAGATSTTLQHLQKPIGHGSGSAIIHLIGPLDFGLSGQDCHFVVAEHDSDATNTKGDNHQWQFTQEWVFVSAVANLCF